MADVYNECVLVLLFAVYMCKVILLCFYKMLYDMLNMV